MANNTKNEVPVQIGRFIDKNTRKEIERRIQRKIPKDIFDAICEFWKNKRYALQKGRKPLIRRLQVGIFDQHSVFLFFLSDNTHTHTHTNTFELC
jgi:predicted glutamine amidotransferase